MHDAAATSATSYGAADDLVGQTRQGASEGAEQTGGAMKQAGQAGIAARKAGKDAQAKQQQSGGGES